MRRGLATGLVAFMLHAATASARADAGGELCGTTPDLPALLRDFHSGNKSRIDAASLYRLQMAPRSITW